MKRRRKYLSADGAGAHRWGLILKFAAAFGILGLVISLLFGFIGGNRPAAVLVTAVICGLLAGGLGAGVYKVLEMRVPELLSALDSSGSSSGSGTSVRDTERARAALEDETGSSDVSGRDPDGEALAGEDGDYSSREKTPAGVASPVVGDKTYGDHIIVNKVKIKNEPKLMAAAIRTMLTKE